MYILFGSVHCSRQSSDRNIYIYVVPKYIYVCTWQKTKLSQLPKVSRSRFCADRAQNQPGPAPNNILGAPPKNVIQSISRHKVFPIVGEASSPSNKIGLSHLSHVHLIWISALQSAVFWPKYIYVVPKYIYVCSLTKNKTFPTSQGLPLSLLRGSRPKSTRASSKQYTGSSQKMSFKSVHFRQSYSRTRERRWNAPQSISNSRRSFFAE